MDNTTAVAYVNHMGGTTAHRLFKGVVVGMPVLSAEHLPGTTADYQSRLVQTLAEWRLEPEVFRVVLHFTGPCRMDLSPVCACLQSPHLRLWQHQSHGLGVYHEAEEHNSLRWG